MRPLNASGNSAAVAFSNASFGSASRTLPSANGRNGTADGVTPCSSSTNQFRRCLWIGRHVDLSLDRPGRVAEKLHLQFLAAFAAGRIGDRRPRKVADVQAVATIVGTAIRSFANENRVLAVLGNDDRQKAILLGEHRVVDRRELESILIENRQEWIEKRLAEANAFDLDREPLAFLGVMR